MREYIADRWEEGVLVCFADGERYADCAARLSIPCPRVPHPEGRRVLVFDAIGEAYPYVRVEGAIALPDGKAALIMPPDEAQESAVRERFGNIFKKRT